MTDVRRISMESLLTSLGGKSVSIEMRKNSRGAVAVISGVVSVSEFSDDGIEILTHGGRIFILGEGLGISALEDHALEIYGRIVEVRLTYGRS